MNRLWIRRSTRWLFVGVGILVGLLGLAIAALRQVPSDPQERVNGLCEVAGPAVFGLLMLSASLIAVRRPRLAGWLLVIAAPAPALLLSYPGTGYLVWYPNGEGIFEQPFPSTAIQLTFLAYLPFAVALLSRRHRKRAAYLFLMTVSFAGIVFLSSRWTAALLPRLAAWTVPFALAGAFWLWVQRKDLDTLRKAGRSYKRLLAVISAATAIVVSGTFLGTVVLTAMSSTLFSPDCSGSPLFARPLRLGHAVFTVRMVRTGHTAKVAGRWAGQWGIGRVEESFGGLPDWSRRWVLVTNNIFQEGGIFFVSGNRASGVLTRYFPFVEATNCGYIYAAPADRAQLELKLLRAAPRPDETRIMGYVLQPALRQPDPRTLPRNRSEQTQSTFAWALTGSAGTAPLVGAKVRISSASGERIVTTDADGIYEAGGFMPDAYTVNVLNPPSHQLNIGRSLEKNFFQQWKLARIDLHLDWDGVIDGRVRDEEGGPAHVWLELRYPDGNLPGNSIQSTGTTAKDGTFAFRNLLPGGHFILRVNPFGPTTDSPYGFFYFPSGTRRENAGSLEVPVHSGRSSNIAITVRRLRERTLEVRVTDAGGHPIENAFVNYAHEGTDDYPNPSRGPFRQTSRGGIVEIQVFGDTKVRVMATQFVDHPNSESTRLNSPVVELDTVRLPRRLELSVSQANPLPPNVSR